MGASATEPPEPVLDPALAAFLGVGQQLDPIDISGIPTATPLFTSVELGPLAGLGPELVRALATVASRLNSNR